MLQAVTSIALGGERCDVRIGSNLRQCLDQRMSRIAGRDAGLGICDNLCMCRPFGSAAASIVQVEVLVHSKDPVRPGTLEGRLDPCRTDPQLAIPPPDAVAESWSGRLPDEPCSPWRRRLLCRRDSRRCLIPSISCGCWESRYEKFQNLDAGVELTHLAIVTIRSTTEIGAPGN